MFHGYPEIVGDLLPGRPLRPMPNYDILHPTQIDRVVHVAHIIDVTRQRAKLEPVRIVGPAFHGGHDAQIRLLRAHGRVSGPAFLVTRHRKHFPYDRHF